MKHYVIYYQGFPFFLLYVIFSFLSSPTLSQEVFSAGSGNATCPNGTISYSIGQMVYTYYFSSYGSIGHGVQQPYEISTHIEKEEEPAIQLFISLFPNPATDYLTLLVSRKDYDRLTYRIIDLNGKLIDKKNITEMESSLFLGGIAQGTYFLIVTKGNKELKTFKIIKL